jgi:amino acid adenylation domain-containing protein
MDLTHDLCVHQLFEQQVTRTPDTIAVVCEEHALTYDELNQHANQLAHLLRRLGIGPDCLVGLCVERSLEMVIALLGILKAGGTYVPLDPSYPRERLTFLLEDCRPTIVLTQGREPAAKLADALEASLEARLLPRQPTSMLDLNEVWDTLRHESALDSACEVVPGQLAYLIYTSGSTGQPKGVQIPHRAVVNFLTSMREQLEFTGEETLLSVTPISFDIAGLELFLPLVVGSRIVVVSQKVARDAERLGLALRQHGATIMQATPSTWRLLLDGDRLACSTLNILCGGETMPPDLAHQLLDLGGTVWNLYGPTETTIWSTVYPLTAVNGPLPIGRPIANTQIYLLDRNLQPMPIGVTGELYIGGVPLARGYINRPDLTAERFIPHPFPSGNWGDDGVFPRGAGERLYRTGDLARYRADGSIEYLGRTDHQIKLRGFRIELGEIEAALSIHPAVRQAVVLLREVPEDRKYLVAYIVPQVPQEEVSTAQLKDDLSQQLPAYMVPIFFVQMPALPLTANGKIDRRALPAPDMDGPAPPTALLPQTTTQQILVEIWQSVLLIDRPIGLHENFFSLGGDSILSLRVVSRARQAGLVLTPRQIFQYQTLSELSAVAKSQTDSLDMQEIVEGPVPLTPIQHWFFAHCLHPASGGYTPSDFPLASLNQATLDAVIAGGQSGALSKRTIEDLYPLTPLQQGILFHTLYAPQSGTYVEQLTCRLQGTLDEAALEQAWYTVIAQHPVLRTSFVWQGLETPLQIVWERVDLPIQLLDWSDRTPQQQQTDLEAFLQADRREGFALEQAPLMHLTLIRLNAASIHLVWSFHHLLLDGWSTSMILQELFVCYSAYMRGKSPLLEHRRPYRDYLAWLHKLDMQQAQEYWQETLSGVQAATPLGIDRKGYSPSESGYAEESLQVDASTTARVQAFARREQLTLNTLMQGAWALVLSCYSGEADVLFGNVIAGRPTELAGAERMVGMFINTLPARVRLPREERVGNWLKQLLQQQAELRQYEYCSLVQVQGWSNLPHDLPLFESLLVFENYPIEAAPIEQTSHLQISAIQARAQTNYPLTIVVSSEDTLHFCVSYERERFEPATIKRLLLHLQHCLQQIVADPQRQLAEVSLLTELEREQQLVQWNAKTVDETFAQHDHRWVGSHWDPQDVYVHQIFEQQAERIPDAVAVHFEDMQVRAIVI